MRRIDTHDHWINPENMPRKAQLLWAIYNPGRVYETEYYYATQYHVPYAVDLVEWLSVEYAKQRIKGTP